MSVEGNQYSLQVCSWRQPIQRVSLIERQPYICVPCKAIGAMKCEVGYCTVCDQVPSASCYMFGAPCNATVALNRFDQTYKCSQLYRTKQTNFPTFSFCHSATQRHSLVPNRNVWLGIVSPHTTASSLIYSVLDPDNTICCFFLQR